jgi:hypothetical protein
MYLPAISQNNVSRSWSRMALTRPYFMRPKRFIRH